MSEPITIIQEIRAGGYEASLITTYNAYLSFYEDVVLRHLMGSGVRHNVLMMDASQAAVAIGQHPPNLAGRYYTLVPMKVSSAFHPKVILMVGKNKGMLLVGSHNLTLSGFGYNREMTNLILYRGKDDIEAANVFNSAWKYIINWSMTQKDALPDQILNMIKKVGNFAPWLHNSTEMDPIECRILATDAGETTLWDQLLSFVLPGPIRRVTVCGAFFDSKLAFIKKIQDDLAPDQLIVGIDPESVQIPADIKLPGANFVNSAQLGRSEKDAQQPGYLHAKSILIEKADQETLLAVGSANPSFPAWLAPGMTGNVEMMLVRKGKDAEAAASDLGLFDIQSMPSLSIQDWEKTKLNWQHKDDREPTGVGERIIIAIALDDKISFFLPGDSNPPVLSCKITLSSGDVVPKIASLADCEYVLTTREIESPAIFVRFELNDINVTGLVQHMKQIEGRSHTELQRRLPEILSSLMTSQPDIEDFVELIQKIISINDKTTTGTNPKRRQNRPEKIHHEESAIESLSIGIKEINVHDRRKKQRLNGSDDLGYLLDILLYNLRGDSPIGLSNIIEVIDKEGRSEEDQVGADDEDERHLVNKNLRPINKQVEKTEKNLLQICHSKVALLVSTACEKLIALEHNRLSIEDLVRIMAGILSALRLLKGCNGKVPWIESGQTAVPKKEFARLFAKITEVCFDGPKSIIYLTKQHESLSSVDELARLKGLIIWLAWESEISLQKKKPFNESREECSKRFQNNRLFVALAQLISQDNDVIDEARQTIGQFSSSTEGWLTKILAVDLLLFELCSNPTQLQNVYTAKPGDFGFNTLYPEFGVREILPKDSNNHALASFSSAKARYSVPSVNIRTIPFDQLFDAKFKSR